MRRRAGTAGAWSDPRGNDSVFSSWHPCPGCKTVQDIFAVDHFFNQSVERIVIVVACLESDPGVAPRQFMELVDHGELLADGRRHCRFVRMRQ